MANVQHLAFRERFSLLNLRARCDLCARPLLLVRLERHVKFLFAFGLFFCAFCDFRLRQGSGATSFRGYLL